MKQRGNLNSRWSRLVRDARPSNWRAVREKLVQVNWAPLYHFKSCDEQFRFFTDTINEIFEKSLPLQRAKIDSNDKPWIALKIKRLIRKRQWHFQRKLYGLSTIQKHGYCQYCYYNKNIADVQPSNPKKWVCSEKYRKSFIA